MRLVRTVFDRDQGNTQPVLPRGLRDLYDGDLHFPAPAERPYVFGNFVNTLDGVVSFKVKGHAGGGTISGSDPADRFIMGLLRASADAIIVGAKTVHDAGPESLWTPEYTYPDASDLYAEYRQGVLHKPRYPLLVIVSGRGRLDLETAVFRTPEARAVVITTYAGRDELARATSLSSVEVRAVDSTSGKIDSSTIVQLLHSQLGVQMLLHEGGPTLFGQFLEAGAIDELFLTLSPQIAGRAGHTNRPGMVEGVEFAPGSAPWLQLLSLRLGADHLYARYRLTGRRPPNR